MDTQRCSRCHEWLSACGHEVFGSIATLSSARTEMVVLGPFGMALWGQQHPHSTRGRFLDGVQPNKAGFSCPYPLPLWEVAMVTQPLHSLFLSPPLSLLLLFIFLFLFGHKGVYAYICFLHMQQKCREARGGAC